MKKQRPATKPTKASSAQKTSIPPKGEVSSLQSTAPAVKPDIPEPPAPAGKGQMNITLTRSAAPRKDNRIVIYNLGDRKGSVQFLATLFEKGAPPAELTISGDFAEPREAKAKETPEARKARLKLLPKLTLEQKVAKAEEKATKLRAKLATVTV